MKTETDIIIKWLLKIGLILGGVIAGFMTVSATVILLDGRIQLSPAKESLYADNATAQYYQIIYRNPLRQRFFPWQAEYRLIYTAGRELIKEIHAKNGFYLKCLNQPGEVRFQVLAQGQILETSLIIRENDADSDNDGLPDAVELDTASDRENFIDWFLAVAESQFYVKSYSWYTMHQDCAGLVTYAYKEALKVHNSAWYKNFPLLVNSNIPDVVKYNYPAVPLLGEQIFRIAGGSFIRNDLSDDKFASTCNANHLLNDNLIFVSKNRADFRQGDILFYVQPEESGMPYHAMIYSGATDYLIYHTGPLEDNDSGEVRKVRFENMLKHPDKRWHPAVDNPNFLGAFRWKIIS